MKLPLIVDIWTELKAHRLKTILSLLGFIIGSALCVGLLSVGLNAQALSMMQFSKLDTDLIHVELIQKSSNTRYLVASQVAEDLKKTEQNIEAITGLFPASTEISIQNERLNALTTLSSPVLYSILKLTPATGRLLLEADGTQSFCVIGHALAEEIFKKTKKSPLHQTLNINHHVFTIVGTLAPSERGAFLFLNVNHTVFLHMAQLPRFTDADVTEWVIKLRSLNALTTSKEKIRQYFHHLSDTVEIRIESLDELIKNIEAHDRLFLLLLLSIGILSLIASGIGIMNVMLISIESRKPEIGLRLTVGALPRDILVQFMKEALFLTAAGAGIGVLLGEGIGFLLCYFFHWPYHLFLLPSSLGITLSVLTGLLFGFYPALKASRVNPLFLLNAS